MNQELSSVSAKWLAVTRIVLGWLMFYAGITKVIDPLWSAGGYLASAKTFAGFYAWLAEPGMLSVVNVINEWGLTLLGISLILGVCVRLSSILGIVLMLLYYLPGVAFPFVNHGFLIDEHIVYAAVFALFASLRAGRYYGLEKSCSALPICAKFPWLRAWLG